MVIQRFRRENVRWFWARVCCSVKALLPNLKCQVRAVWSEQENSKSEALSVGDDHTVFAQHGTFKAMISKRSD